MTTVDAYERYLDATKKDLIEHIHDKLGFLKVKFILSHHLTDERHFGLFYRVLREQRLRQHLFRKRRFHLKQYYMKKFKELPLSRKNKERMMKRLQGIDVMYSFMGSSSPLLTKQLHILDKKLKRLRRKQKQHHLVKKAKRILGSDLHSLLLEEEKNLSLIMTIFGHRGNHLLEYAKDMRKLEKLAKAEKKLLTSALIFNTLPVHGVGDAISLPFWLGEGAVQLYEHHFKEYKDWKASKKRHLNDLKEELENLDFEC